MPLVQGRPAQPRNRATAQPRNSAGESFTQSQFGKVALRNLAGGLKRNSADMHGKTGILQDARKHKERADGFCLRWFVPFTLCHIFRFPVLMCFVFLSLDSYGEESTNTNSQRNVTLKDQSATYGSKFEDYQVEGSVVFSGKPLKNAESGTFVMRVEGCNWNIRFRRPNDPDYTEVGFDGTNSFVLFSYEHFVEGKKSANVATANLSKSEIPRSVFIPQFAMLWLTYGSRCYFDRKSQGDMLEPVITWDIHGNVERRKAIPLYKTIWKRQDQFPFLPIEVIYVEPIQKGNLINGTNTNYTNSIFRVSSFTNNEGFEFPKAASLETYQFMNESNSGIVSLKLFSRYELELTAVRKITTPDLTTLPSLPGKTFFVDDRFPQVGQISYLSSNFMTESQLVTNKGYKTFVGKPVNYIDNNNVLSGRQIFVRRAWIIIVLATLSAVPLIIITVKYINKKTKKE